MPARPKRFHEVDNRLHGTGRRICTDCDQIKQESDFGKKGGGYNDLRADCKDCYNAKRRTPEARAKRREYHKRNPDVAARGSKKWREANPEKHRANHDNWGKENQCRVNKSARKSYWKSKGIDSTGKSRDPLCED